MNEEIRIEKNNGKIDIYTPYNSTFVKAIKLIGGARFDGQKRCWVLPEDYIEDVRAILFDVYGCDDQGAPETVDIKVEVYEGLVSGYCKGIDIANRTIAYATGRDSGAKVGRTTMLVEGEIDSGGSKKNWTTEISAGSVFKVKGVLKSMLEKEIDEDGNWIGLPAKITILSENIDVEALKEEKKRLEARLAEIEKTLGKEVA
jgi:predicted DNA-binding transcriptional regulator